MGAKKSTAITTVKQELHPREWSEQIKAQPESGMTVTAFCTQNGIMTQNYYYHLCKVREHFVESEPAIVPVAIREVKPSILY